MIVGAGVSGLTAATELALRGMTPNILFSYHVYMYGIWYIWCIGYEVVIYERQAIPGGKVKAYLSPDGLPMEHGYTLLFYYLYICVLVLDSCYVYVYVRLIM